MLTQERRDMFAQIHTLINLLRAAANEMERKLEFHDENFEESTPLPQTEEVES